MIPLLFEACTITLECHNGTNSVESMHSVEFHDDNNSVLSVHASSSNVSHREYFMYISPNKRAHVSKKNIHFRLMYNEQ